MAINIVKSLEESLKKAPDFVFDFEFHRKILLNYMMFMPWDPIKYDK